jgi:hypothetical protein
MNTEMQDRRGHIEGYCEELIEDFEWLSKCPFADDQPFYQVAARETAELEALVKGYVQETWRDKDAMAIFDQLEDGDLDLETAYRLLLKLLQAAA